MRTIKFKAKIDTDYYEKINKSYWVYGYYTEDGATFQGPVIEAINDDYKVIRETVCPLVIQNGKLEIYENDIIEVTVKYDNPNGDVGLASTLIGLERYILEWDTDVLGYFFHYINPSIGEICRNEYLTWEELQEYEDFTVIGNKFDNPNLIKENYINGK